MLTVQLAGSGERRPLRKVWVQDKVIIIAFYRKPQRILRRRSQSVGGSCKHVAAQKPRKEAMTNRPMDLAQGLMSVVGENNFREGWEPERSLDEVREWRQGRQTGAL